MKHIFEYLSTKIDLSKSQIFPDDYCVAEPIDNTFKEFLAKAYMVVALRNGLKLFILTKKEAAKYIDNEDVVFYNIPDKYKDIRDCIYALSKYDIDDFKEMSIDELYKYK